MKKIMALIAVLALLCATPALADIGDRLRVVNCNEYITLREEPSTSAASLAHIPLGASVDELYWAGNGFVCVSYRGKTGYALSEYLSTTSTYRGSDVSMTSGQRYNINLFLSNFTETGFLWRSGCYDESYTDAGQLTRFAIDHCWFNRQNRLEWGVYFNGNNVRLPEDQIAPIVKKYFGVNISPSHEPPYMDYKKGYYYWQETGGHTNDGFACLYNVESLGGGRYCVWFDVYGMGENWDNDVCYYDEYQAESAYQPYGSYAPYGRAIIDVGSSGLNDRSDWSLVRFAINRD